MTKSILHLVPRSGLAAVNGAHSTGAGAGLIQAYGVLLSAQPSLAALDAIGIPAETHLESARSHMNSWLNPAQPAEGLKARIQTAVDAVINWNGSFQAFWPSSGGFDENIAVLRSSSTTDDQKTAALHSIADKLGILSGDLSGLNAHAHALEEDLASFQEALTSDHTKFEGDFDAFLKQKDDKDSSLGKLKSKLDGINAQVGKDIAIIATSTVVLVGTVGAMAYSAYIDFDFGELAVPLLTVGLGVVSTTLFEIVSRSGELHSLETQASDLQAQVDSIASAVAAASLLSNNLKSLATGCGSAITGIAHIATAWSTLDTDMQKVIQDCRNGIDSNAQTVVAWLEQAKADWTTAQDACERIKDLGFQSTGMNSEGKVTLRNSDMIKAIRRVGPELGSETGPQELPACRQSLEQHVQ